MCNLSHLYGFYPGDQITPDSTVELFDAVRRTLELGGDAAVGWSMGWKISCWARQVEGVKARGNFEVDINWEGGQLTRAELLSLAGENCRIRAYKPFEVYRDNKKITSAAKVDVVGKTCYEAGFVTEKGGVYRIQ